MCGRFILIAPGIYVAKDFSLREEPSLEPRYNIAPGQNIAAIRQDTDSSHRVLHMLKWGLIPSWAKDKKMGYRMINAKSETAAGSPAFRAAFKRRRCLIPSDGFYEWKKLRSHKQPYLIRMADSSCFAFAGLWEHWEGTDGEIIESCTILTTSPNTLLEDLHNRMPVILNPSDYSVWLDPSVKDPRQLQDLFSPFPSDRLAFHPVSTRVNKPVNDDPECITPIP